MSSLIEADFALAMQTLQAGPESAAITAFEQLTQSWPECKEAWYMLGDLQLRQGQWNEATYSFEQVLNLDPQVQEVYFQLGLMSLWQGLSELAESYWQRALQINPEYAEPRYHLGLLWLRNKQEAKAKAAFTCLLEQHPERQAQLWQTAQEQLQLGQIHESLALCEILQPKPQTPEPQRTLLEIQGLQRSGQDQRAREAIACLPEPFQSLLTELYLPLYPDQEALQTVSQAMQKRVTESPSLPAKSMAWFPQLSSWQLLPKSLQISFQDWLTLPLKALSRPPMRHARQQRLVWVVDVPCLSWRQLYFQHLAALPPARWEIQVLLRIPYLQSQLPTEALQKLRIQTLTSLANDPETALQQLQALQADVILFSGPEQDPLQFWLAHQPLATLQLAWSPHQTSLQFESSPLARDGSAPLWLGQCTVSAARPDNPLLIPLGQTGLHPETLHWLQQVKHPLRLCCMPQDLLNVHQLQTQLPASSVAIWQDLPALQQLIHHSAGILLPDGSGQLYAQMAQTLNRPVLRSPHGPDWPAAALLPDPHTLQQSLQAIPPPHRDALPETRWAVHLQDQLSQHRKALQA